MKMLKISLIAVVSLVLLGVVAFYVDYYYYSWTSFIQPFGCEYKSIGPSGVTLEQVYDLDVLVEKLRPDSNYLVNHKNKYSLTVSRIFRNVNYTIHFSGHNSEKGVYYDLSYSNGHFNLNSNEGTKQNEVYTTPDYYILQNINQMIDEMPLTDIQKQELKNKVTVRCWSGHRFP
jgi:hypothetical protein